MITIGPNKQSDPLPKLLESRLMKLNQRAFISRISPGAFTLAKMIFFGGFPFGSYLYDDKGKDFRGTKIFLLTRLPFYCQ